MEVAQGRVRARRGPHVGLSHRGHAKRFRALEERCMLDRAVEQRVLRMQMEVNEGFRHVLDSLDTLPARFHKTLDLPVTGHPIHVHLLSSRRRYRAHVRERIPDRGKRRALYLKAPDRGYVFAFRHNDWSRDLHHECTHALIHNALPYLPLWLDEGLAEYFEGPPSVPAGSHPHLSRLRWSMQLGWTPSLERLESLRGFQSIATRDYRESWAWVHFLLHGPPAAQRALADYLVAIRQNRPPGLFSRWIKPRLPGAAEALKMHLADLSR